MRSSDLPVGAHVAYDRNHSHSYPGYVQAFIIAHRSKGNKTSYWGIPNGNGNTVGIAWHTNYYDKSNTPEWGFTWVRPANIHMTWDEYSVILDIQAKRDADRVAKHKADVADRKARWTALPVGVHDLIEDYKVDHLMERGEINTYISLKLIEAIVAAAQAELPERKAERVAAEIEDALQLLG